METNVNVEMWTPRAPRVSWNRGKLIGQKAPLKLTETYAIGKRVALPPRIFRIMLAHSLALTSGDKRGERRSEVGVLDEAG